jgi:hypothetical protein
LATNQYLKPCTQTRLVKYNKLKEKPVEVIVVIAFLSIFALVWLIWQLLKAKQFTRFKQLIESDLKPKVIEHIIEELTETRSELFPNTEIHQQASIYYWTQYKGRILKAALAREIIDEKWLKDTGNLRNCQHLFHVEQRFL